MERKREREAEKMERRREREAKEKSDDAESKA